MRSFSGQFQGFRQKVKHIVNHSNYGATVKAEKLAPVVRGWRNYHRFCKMDGSRFSLYYIQQRAFKVFNKETKKIAIPVRNYWIKLFRRFLTPKTNTSMLGGVSHPSTEIQFTGVSVIANSTMEQPQKP